MKEGPTAPRSILAVYFHFQAESEEAQCHDVLPCVDQDPPKHVSPPLYPDSLYVAVMREPERPWYGEPTLQPRPLRFAYRRGPEGANFAVSCPWEARE